jgi:hypothetical protein
MARRRISPAASARHDNSSAPRAPRPAAIAQRMSPRPQARRAKAIGPTNLLLASHARSHRSMKMLQRKCGQNVRRDQYRSCSFGRSRCASGAWRARGRAQKCVPVCPCQVAPSSYIVAGSEARRRWQMRALRAFFAVGNPTHMAPLPGREDFYFISQTLKSRTSGESQVLWDSWNSIEPGRRENTARRGAHRKHRRKFCPTGSVGQCAGHFPFNDDR